MFVPIVMVSPVKDLQEGIALANDVQYGLTAGFYGSPSEVDWFFDHIQAGVVYTNRPQGGTTGAWPGFQPFGGWKGSGSSGKNSGGFVLRAALPARTNSQHRAPPVNQIDPQARMKTLLRSFGRILTLVGLANLAWLLINCGRANRLGSFRSWGCWCWYWASPAARAPGRKTRRQRFPSQREEEKHKHKSWIESGKN